MAAGLAVCVLPAAAAEKGKSKGSAPASRDAAPAAASAPAVSPELKAFEKTLNDLGPLAKTLEDGEGGPPVGHVQEMLTKLKQVSTEKLPEDVKKAFDNFTSMVADMHSFTKLLPADLSGPELKKWIQEKVKADGEEAKQLKEALTKMAALEPKIKSGLAEFRLAAFKNGLNLRPFLQPESIGHELMKPIDGSTTPKKFEKDVLATLAGRNAEIAKQKEKGLRTMGDIATLHRAQTALRFKIPVAGLPVDLGAAFQSYRELAEAASWRVADVPAGLPLVKEDIVGYMTEAAKTDPGIVQKLQSSSTRMKKGQRDQDEAAAELVKVAKGHGLEISAMLEKKREQPTKASPEK